VCVVRPLEESWAQCIPMASMKLQVYPNKYIKLHLGLFHTGASTCCEYSRKKSLFLVLPLSIDTDATALIARASTRGHCSENDLLTGSRE